MPADSQQVRLYEFHQIATDKSYPLHFPSPREPIFQNGESEESPETARNFGLLEKGGSVVLHDVWLMHKHTNVHNYATHRMKRYEEESLIKPASQLEFDYNETLNRKH